VANQAPERSATNTTHVVVPDEIMAEYAGDVANRPDVAAKSTKKMPVCKFHLTAAGRWAATNTLLPCSLSPSHSVACMIAPGTFDPTHSIILFYLANSTQR